MDLFFFESIFQGETLFIPATEARHFASLRKKIKDEIALTNGQGTKAHARIRTWDKKGMVLELLSLKKYPLPHRTSLAIAYLSHKNRMEYVIEKAVEIGVAEILFLRTERSEKKCTIPPLRLARIMQSALSQSRQYHLPATHFDLSLSQLFAYHRKTHNYIAHCLEKLPREPLSAHPRNPDTRLLLIGPEGDFSETEIHNALAEGCVPISLSTQRLRAETAAVCALSYFNGL